MKKVFKASLLLLAAAVIFSGCSKTESKKDYILATGGTGGTYYPFGGAIANIWNTKLDNMNVTAQATGASADTVRTEKPNCSTIRNTANTEKMMRRPPCSRLSA